MSIPPDVESITEARRNLNAHIDAIRRYGDDAPHVFIGRHRRSEAVLIPYDTYLHLTGNKPSRRRTKPAAPTSSGPSTASGTEPVDESADDNTALHQLMEQRPDLSVDEALDLLIDGDDAR